MSVAADSTDQTVRVLLFGALRERLRRAELIVHQPVSTVAEVWDAVTAARPDVARMRDSVRCARNLDYCTWETPVSDRDEVAFMPPVCGGASDDAAGVSVTLTDQPIDVGALLDHAGTDEDGAVACFLGRVRDRSDGEAVHRLDYEAYTSMALAEMRRIAATARDRHGVTTVALVHRTGALAVGEIAVAVVTTSAHRGAALDSCRDVIDAVKRDVPIWKREHRADGARWVDARC